MLSTTIRAGLFLIAYAAFAQSDRASITGTVFDPAGAPVPGAAINATNVETGAVYPTLSTATGNYTIPQVPPGSYEISVGVPGFKSFVRSGVTVAVAQTLRIDVTLEVGSSSEAVTVRADAALLKTDSGDLSHNVTVRL